MRYDENGKTVVDGPKIVSVQSAMVESECGKCGKQIMYPDGIRPRSGGLFHVTCFQKMRQIKK